MIKPCCVLSQEQEIPRLKELNVLKTNPLAVLWSQIPFTGEVRATYERVMSLDQSSVISLSYVFLSPVDIVREFVRDMEDSLGVNILVRGARVQAAYRFYLSSDEPAPYGIYIGPHASVNGLNLAVKGFPNDYINIYYANAGFLAGYQFRIGPLFVGDVYIGAGYKYNFAEEHSADKFRPSQFELGKGFKPSFSMNAGCAF